MTEKPNLLVRLAWAVIGSHRGFPRSLAAGIPFAACLVALLAAADCVTAADVIVVCPHRFREALTPWVDHRRGEGLAVVVIAAERDAQAMRRAIRDAADDGTGYVMLVGDAPVIGTPCNTTSQVPICYSDAQITTAWGSTPTMATDMLFGDFDSDGNLSFNHDGGLQAFHGWVSGTTWW